MKQFFKNAITCGKPLLRSGRSGGHCRRYQRLHRHEQRGAGREEKDHDGGRCLHLPDCSRQRTASVLRYHRLTTR